SWQARTLGGVFAVALAVVSAVGDSALMRGSHGWMQIDRKVDRADLVMAVPRDAQGTVFATVFGDSPDGSDTIRWPPVCEVGTEWWCRGVAGVQTVGVDEVTDGVLTAAAAFRRSVWFFNVTEDMDPASFVRERLPAPLRRCEQMFANEKWLVLDCASTSL